MTFNGDPSLERQLDVMQPVVSRGGGLCSAHALTHNWLRPYARKQR